MIAAKQTRISTQLGPIAADQSYPIECFKRLTGLSDWAMRTARRHGLKVRRAGNRKYILGKDWLAYLDRDVAA